MPQFYIQQKIFTLVDSYAVYNQAGSEIYRVKSRFFAIPKQIDIYNSSDQVLYTLRKQLFRFLPTFTLLDGGGNEVAAIRKRFTFFRPVIDIESSLGSFTIEGELFAHHFQLFQDGLLKASISKRWFSLGDAYELDISDSDNIEFYVALLISIDQAVHEQKSNRH